MRTGRIGKLVSLVLTFTFLLSVTVVAGPIEIKLGSTITTTHPHMEAARYFGELVKERTNGQVVVQVFPDGQLGREADIFEGVMMGSIQMYLVAPSMVARYYPPMGVSDMAYIWNDAASQRTVMRGAIGQEMAEGILKSTGTRVLDFSWDYGCRQITANVPATKPDDLRGLKIRCPDAPLNVALGRALGYTPTPVAPSEVYTAIQQKVIDGQENPIPTIYARKFNEVNGCIILTGHLHQFEVLGINEAFFRSLSPDLQQIIQEAAWEAGDYASARNAEDEERLLKELERSGMQVVYPDVDVFRAATAPVAKQFEDQWGKGLFETIKSAQQ